MALFIVLSVVGLLTSLALSYFSPHKLVFNILAGICLISGIILITQAVIERIEGVKFNKSIDSRVATLESIILNGMTKYEYPSQLSNVINTANDYAKKISQYGGALYIKVAIHGANTDGTYLLDYGDKADLTHNRVSLIAYYNNTLQMVLYDNDGVEYALPTAIDIKPSNIYDILCVWNKEYGDVALFVNGEKRGYRNIKPLKIKRIAGELTVGSNLLGKTQGSIVVQKIGVFAFE